MEATPPGQESGGTLTLRWSGYHDRRVAVDARPSAHRTYEGRGITTEKNLVRVVVPRYATLYVLMDTETQTVTEKARRGCESIKPQKQHPRRKSLLDGGLEKRMWMWRERDQVEPYLELSEKSREDLSAEVFSAVEDSAGSEPDDRWAGLMIVNAACNKVPMTREVRIGGEVRFIELRCWRTELRD